MLNYAVAIAPLNRRHYTVVNFQKQLIFVLLKQNVHHQ